MPNATIPEVRPEDRELLGANELAALLGVSSRHIWRMASRGALPGQVRLGGRTLWRRRSIMRWLDSLESNPCR